MLYDSIVLDNEDNLLVDISVQRLYIHAIYFFGLKIIFVI